MQLITETQIGNQKALIVDKTSSSLMSQIRKQLVKYEIEVFISPHILPHLEQFEVVFIINETFASVRKILQSHNSEKLVFVYRDHPKLAVEIEQYIHKFYPQKKANLKCIDIQSQAPLSAEDMEKFLWFTLRQNQVVLLTIHPLEVTSEEHQIPQLSKNNISPPMIIKRFSPRRILKYAAFLTLLLHLAFIPPLMITNFLLYQTQENIKKDITSGISTYKKAVTSLNLTKTLYNLVRPTYQLFSLSHHTDGIIQLDESIALAFEKGFSLYYETNTFTKLLLKKNKTTTDINAVHSTVNKISEDLDAFNQYITIVIQKLPEWKSLDNSRKSLISISETVKTVQKVVPQLDSIFAKNTQKKYLLLFANNMELRPGGGFIGSFSEVTIHNYTVDPLKVYDVYDADGQLKNHIDPPDPIRKYLQQPHWFLRDSAFSPDFPTNYQQAKVFLKEEMNMTDFDGGILLTTTTIQNILEGMGSLYIPAFKEEVNKKNFYIKAQMYAEQDFFPGSTKKKRFLGAVADQLFLNLENSSKIKLIQMLKKSLEEKQMVIYFDDANVQSNIDSLYWSGKTLVPKCPQKFANCINNYMLPYEANLGVNKANFFVKKYIKSSSTIDNHGNLTTKLEIDLKNESIRDIFPGGTYKNYFQTILPNTAVVRKITKNGTLVDTFDTSEGVSKTIGFYIEVPPQTVTELEIEYVIETGLEEGKGAYQFVIQKQIGSPNSEFKFELSYPKNISVISQNFSPLVKNNKILYNTTLTADKIFFIELFKE